VVNIGAGLAKMNRRVLLIDLDPQKALLIDLELQSQPKRYMIFLTVQPY